MVDAEKSKIEKIYCVNCGKLFERYKKNNIPKGSKTRGKRPHNSITCSRKCSKEHTYKNG